MIDSGKNPQPENFPASWFREEERCLIKSLAMDSGMYTEMSDVQLVAMNGLKELIVIVHAQEAEDNGEHEIWRQDGSNLEFVDVEEKAPSNKVSIWTTIVTTEYQAIQLEFTDWKPPALKIKSVSRSGRKCCTFS